MKLRTILVLFAAMLFTSAIAADTAGSISIAKGALTLGGYVQAGFFLTSEKFTPSDGTKPTTSDLMNNFTLRRARLRLSADIAEKIAGGILEYDFAGASVVEGYGWVSPEWEPMRIAAGKLTIPWSQELLTSTRELIWVDRSLLYDYFAIGCDYGLRMMVDAPLDDQNRFKLGLMVSNGYDLDGALQLTDNDTKLDAIYIQSGELIPTTSRTDLKNVTGRVGWEGKLNDELTLGFGAAFMLAQASQFDNETNTLSTKEHLPITTDFTAKYTGMTVLGSFAMDTSKSNDKLYTIDALDPTSWIVSETALKDEVIGFSFGVAYLLPVDGITLLTAVEPAVRYSALTDKQDITITGTTNKNLDRVINQVSGGVNLILDANYAKLQLNYVMQDQKDYPYAPDAADPTAAWVRQNADHTLDNKVQAQLQIGF